MSNRINIGKTEPAAYKAMMALESYLEKQNSPLFSRK